MSDRWPAENGKGRVTPGLPRPFLSGLSRSGAPFTHQIEAAVGGATCDPEASVCNDLRNEIEWVVLGTYRRPAEPAFEPTESFHSIFSDSESPSDEWMIHSGVRSS